jgi:hypothetical protein
MKKFITILMCLNLVMAPVAMAQTDSSSQFTENPDSKAKNSSYMNQILAVSQAAVGSTVILNCSMAKLLPSLIAYAAGSIAYIGSEVMGGKAHSEMLKKKAADIKMIEEKLKAQGGGGEVQKEALEQALKEQKDTAAFIKKRKMWLMAITAIYTTATALAVIELMKVPVPLAQPPLQVGVCKPSTNAGIIAKGVSAAYSFGASMTSSGPIGQYGSMATGLMFLIPGVSASIMTALNAPPGRIAIFGASTLLVGKIMVDLGSKEKVIKGNIEKLEKALAEFKATTSTGSSVASDINSATTSGSADGSSSNNGQANLNTTMTGGSAAGVTALPSVADTNVPKTCFTQTSEGMQYSEAGCTKPTTLNVPTFDASIAVPTLKTATIAATNMGNALAAGDLGKAEVEAGTLGTLAGRLNQIRDSLLTKANDQLKASGKAPIDLNGSGKDQLAALEKAGGFGSSSTASNGSTSGSSGFGNSSNSSGEDSSSSDKAAGNESMKINTAGSDTAVGVPTSGAETTGLEAISEEALIGETGAVAPTDAMKEASLTKKLGQYESNESDISDDADFSIFKQVSNRYLLNYPKIFEKKLDQPQRK